MAESLLKNPNNYNFYHLIFDRFWRDYLPVEGRFSTFSKKHMPTQGAQTY